MSEQEMNEGSLFKVPLTTIQEIKPHANADRLEFCRVYGFEVIAQKGLYQVGDKVIFVPVDSILPDDLEALLFPEGSKIKLHDHRVRQIRIRGLASQGMLIPPGEVSKWLPKDLTVEEDYANALGIVKYEPPTPMSPNQKEAKPKSWFDKILYKLGIKRKKKQKENENFKKYGGLNNIKWFPFAFTEGEQVVVEEKIHGSHIRAGYAPVIVDTPWKAIKKFFGYLPEYEYVYGSNNVQLQERGNNYKGYYGDNLYKRVLDKYAIEHKLEYGEYIHGEVYGSGIQANYSYGCEEGEHKLVIFDVKYTDLEGYQHYMTPEERDRWLTERGLWDCKVPTIYNGPFNADQVKQLTLGDSVLAPSQKVREGIVVRNVDYTNGPRKIYKMISEAYLDDRTNTDNH